MNFKSKWGQHTSTVNENPQLLAEIGKVPGKELAKKWGISYGYLGWIAAKHGLSLRVKKDAKQ